MKREVFEQLLKDNGIELNENVKIDAIWDGVDTAIGGAVKSTRENTLEKMKDEAKELAQADYIKSLNIEGVENDNQLKAHMSSLASNEDGQELIKLRSEFETMKTEYGDYKTETAGYKSQLAQYENERFIAKTNPNVDADYLAFKVDKYDGETFADKYNAFREDTTNDKYYTVEPINPKTTGKPRVAGKPAEVSGVRQILIDQGKIKP